MALPTPLFAFLESGIQVKIVGAVAETRKPIIVFDKEMFRDVPTFVNGAAAGSLGANASAVANGIAPTASVNAAVPDATASGESSVKEEDAYKHVPKRYVPKLDTLIEFWDAATVGHAMTLSVTTLINNATITVPDATLLTPKQGITGTGIPAGTTILSILSQANGIITTTTAVMSQQATASGTVAATLTGANKVGEVMQSEFLCWGTEISTPN